MLKIFHWSLVIALGVCQLYACSCVHTLSILNVSDLFRGTKNTLWEGGVHGVGFVHSRLLKKRHLKSDNMIHVSDWLPTLYSAAGGDVSDLGQIDGKDMWNMIQNDGPGIRDEILHNIDPISKFSAIRVGDYKLIQGDLSHGRDDHWYPCSYPFHSQDQNEYNGNHGDEDLDNDKKLWTGVYNKTIKDLYEKKMSYLPKQRTMFDRHVPFTPYNIACGERPANYTTNCIPKQSACLFHIPTDPCEYNNIADAYPAVVENLKARIKEYADGAVKPVNKPADKLADPSLHGGVWVPWQGSDL